MVREVFCSAKRERGSKEPEYRPMGGNGGGAGISHDFALLVWQGSVGQSRAAKTAIHVAGSSSLDYFTVSLRGGPTVLGFP